VQLKVGKILAAEKVEKPDKLLKLSVEWARALRAIVAGIGSPTREQLINKTSSWSRTSSRSRSNGIDSKGMLLAGARAKRADPGGSRPLAPGTLIK